MSRRDPGRPEDRARAEEGSSTVLALAVVAAVLTLTVGGLAVLGSLRAVHVARSAADLAALAAAGQLQEGSGRGAACARARRIATSHDARVTACEVAGSGEVTVTATAPIRGRLAGVGPSTATGRARAGPAPW